MSLMDEIIFIIEESPEGGYVARALGESIVTQADHLKGIQASIRDAVKCHFETGKEPKIIRLHYTRDEVIAV